MKTNKMMRNTIIRRAMKINSISYKNAIRKVMEEQYKVIPVVSKMKIKRMKDGQMKVTNMVIDEESSKPRFTYGIVGNSKAIRQLKVSDLKTKLKVAVEEQKDDGSKITYKVNIAPDGRYRYYDEIIMVHFEEGVSDDLLLNGFKVLSDGTVVTNDNTATDKINTDDTVLEFGAPCWGPSNEKHSDSFFMNINKRSRDEWYKFLDGLTGDAFEYRASLELTVKKHLKDVTRWGNYLTGSIAGPEIDLRENYICIIHDEQRCEEDFENIPKYVDPGCNIQDGGMITNALMWKDFFEKHGIELSEEDTCKLSPQSRYDVFNSKCMETIRPDAKINRRLEKVKKLYGAAVKFYGNTNGRCEAIVDTDGAKLLNMEALEAGDCVIKSVVLAFAKTSKSSTSGQLLDKYTKKNSELTKEIITKLYREQLNRMVEDKTMNYFDKDGKFSDNMLSLQGRDALNFTQVAADLTKDLFNFGVKAIGKLKVSIDSMYSHAKFDNSYVITGGAIGHTLYVKYLPAWDNYAVEAYNPDILEEKADEIKAIYEDKTLSEKQKEEALDALLTCVTIKYPSAGPEEYEIVRYLTKEELMERINKMELPEEDKDDLRNYWELAQYGVTVYAPINIMKNKLAGMDIDFDATLADFSELKNILLADRKRVVDFIDYFDKAHK